MKKFLISFSIIIYLFMSLPLGVLANNQQNTQVSKVEAELFGFDYSNDTFNNRITRLEKSVYGKEMKGNLNARVAKLLKDVNAEQLGKEISPKEDTFVEDDLIADNTVNYPVVDEIEMKLFNQTYPNRDFHTRIVTIEKKLFKTVYDAEDYSNRMDRIKAEVMPERLAREKVFGYDNSESLTQNDLSGLNQNRFSTAYGQENYTRPYANYGKYGDYGSTNITDDLAQLEYNTFGTEFSNEDTNKRIKRLNSVNKAKKSSSRYDSQKFNQRMSTAMEIGAMLLMILAMVL